jgi:hypothetical protein
MFGWSLYNQLGLYEYMRLWFTGTAVYTLVYVSSLIIWKPCVLYEESEWPVQSCANKSTVLHLYTTTQLILTQIYSLMLAKCTTSTHCGNLNYCQAGYRWQHTCNAAHKLCMLCNSSYRYTLRICNTYCSSTARFASRRRLNISFIRKLLVLYSNVLYRCIPQMEKHLSKGAQTGNFLCWSNNFSIWAGKHGSQLSMSFSQNDGQEDISIVSLYMITYTNNISHSALIQEWVSTQNNFVTKICLRIIS